MENHEKFAGMKFRVKYLIFLMSIFWHVKFMTYFVIKELKNCCSFTILNRVVNTGKSVR